MKAVTTFLTGAAGLAAIAAFASPASAQGYPYGYGYPNQGYNQGYNQNGGVVGAIINGVLGYGQYPYGNYGYGQSGPYYQAQSLAVGQCARAAEARLGGGGYGYGGGYNGGYNQPYGGRYNQPYGGGYNQQYGYNNGYNRGRVLGISRVDRKSYGYRVYGVATTGMGQYGGNRPDVKFDCKVEGNGRIRDVNINRNMSGYRYGYGW